MGEREGYEVLRLIEHNQKCYISSDYVEGKSLIQWLKYHPNLTKKQCESVQRDRHGGYDATFS